MENEQLLGEHYLIELWGCNKLDYNKDELQRLMEEAAVICECTIVQSVFHQFNPHGLSGVVVIAESHLAIHTWPEFKSAVLDIFTCKLGSEEHVKKAFDFLCDAFQATSHKMRVEKRVIGA
jgi:S-adenosylmethionine decarboxylase